MNWTKAFCILVWLILFILGWDLALGWLSMASTLANIAGAFLVLFIVFISVKTKLFTKNILFSTQGFLLALITLIAITCLCLRVTVFNCNFHSTLFLRHNVCIHTYNYLNNQIDHFSDYVSNNNNPDPFENDLIKVIKSSLSLRFVTLNLDTIRNEMFSYFYGDREFLPDVSFPNISNSDIEKIAKHIPSSSFKTLKKINLIDGYLLGGLSLKIEKLKVFLEKC